MKKITLILLSIFLTGTLAFTNGLYTEGYDNGYNDGLKAIKYFVSPALGQPQEWARGYNDGVSDGEYERMNSADSGKFATFNRELSEIVDLFKAVNFSNNDIDLNQYMSNCENMFEKIRINIENDDEAAGIEKGTLLRQYSEFARNMDSYDRTSFTPLNRKLIEYLSYRFQMASENGSKIEMRYYDELLKKIVDLINK